MKVMRTLEVECLVSFDSGATTAQGSGRYDRPPGATTVFILLPEGIWEMSFDPTLAQNPVALHPPLLQNGFSLSRLAML
jgi:hypothetical protein